MRKTLRIIFFILMFAYLCRWLFPFKINLEEYYITAIVWIYTIPWAIYESSQLIKDDKVNGTHVFRNRLIMMAVAAIIMVLSSIYLNRIYHI